MRNIYKKAIIIKRKSEQLDSDTQAVMIDEHMRRRKNTTMNDDCDASSSFFHINI